MNQKVRPRALAATLWRRSSARFWSTYRPKIDFWLELVLVGMKASFITPHRRRSRHREPGSRFQTGKPVISNHLENEQRFRTPELLLKHGIRRAMKVILQGDGSPYGVLEVDSRSEGEFSERDIAFLQGAGNILGMAIERERYERELKSALDRHQVLASEMSHRVKNSLQIASSMLHLQASTTDDDTDTSDPGIRSRFCHRPRLRTAIP